MQLPKYYETFMPILTELSDGKAIHYNVLRKKVRDKYYNDLPEELLNKKTKSGDILILNRIGWAILALKIGKYLERPERAIIKISQKGLEVLKKGSLTLSELSEDQDYQAYLKNKREEAEKESEINLSNSSPQDVVEAGLSAMEREVKNEILEKLFKDVNHYYFEKIVLLLLKKMGYGDITLTSKSRDGGIDGVINQDQLGLDKIYMQAKHFSEDNLVREKHIRDFIGAMSGDTNKGIFVTTSKFDPGAVKKAQDANHVIILIDGDKLVDLMYNFGVGVQVHHVYEVKQLDQDFYEENN